MRVSRAIFAKPFMTLVATLMGHLGSAIGQKTYRQNPVGMGPAYTKKQVHDNVDKSYVIILSSLAIT